MRRILALLIISASLISASCEKDEVEETIQPLCEVEATVVDLRKLDGCRFVFELNDGTRLEPIIKDCIILGVDRIEDLQSDPLYNFEFVDGRKVKISYEIMDDYYATACMAATVVKITCLTESSVQHQF